MPEDLKLQTYRTPNVKPPRRKPGVSNKSQRGDYSKEYMKEYRAEGKDYQKKPDAIKELQKKQKESLKKKFNLGKKVASEWIRSSLDA